MTTRASKALVTARVSLLFDHPFFGNLATRLRLVEADEWCGTIASDGAHLYYSSEHVLASTPDQRVRSIADLVLHMVLGHDEAPRDPDRSALRLSVLDDLGIGASPASPSREDSDSTFEPIDFSIPDRDSARPVLTRDEIDAFRIATRTAALNSSSAVGRDRTPDVVARHPGLRERRSRPQDGDRGDPG